MNLTGNNVLSQMKYFDYSECLPNWAKDEKLYNVEGCNTISKNNFFEKFMGIFR